MLQDTERALAGAALVSELPQLGYINNTDTGVGWGWGGPQSALTGTAKSLRASTAPRTIHLCTITANGHVEAHCAEGQMWQRRGLMLTACVADRRPYMTWRSRFVCRWVVSCLHIRVSRLHSRVEAPRLTAAFPAGHSSALEHEEDKA